MVGPWVTLDLTGAKTLHWLRVDAGGAVTASSAIPTSMTGGLILNAGATDELVAVLTSSLGAGPATFYARVSTIKDGATAPPSTQTLFDLPSYSTTFDAQFTEPALDGQHWLFVAGPGLETELDVVLAGLDGMPIAPKKAVSTPGSWTCGGMQPTAGAGVVFVVEDNQDGTESFHLIELSASGDISWQARVPLHRDRPAGWNASALPCPEVALTDGGLAFVAYEAGATNSAWHLHRVGRDGGATDEAWDALSSGTPRGLAVRGDVAMAILRHGDSTLGVVKRTGGQDQEWPLPLTNAVTVLGSDGPIASEAGRLFLDVGGSTSDPSAPFPRAIVEVTCP